MENKINNHKKTELQQFKTTNNNSNSKHIRSVTNDWRKYMSNKKITNTYKQTVYEFLGQYM